MKFYIWVKQEVLLNDLMVLSALKMIWFLLETKVTLCSLKFLVLSNNYYFSDSAFNIVMLTITFTYFFLKVILTHLHACASLLDEMIMLASQINSLGSS